MKALVKKCSAASMVIWWYRIVTRDSLLEASGFLLPRYLHTDLFLDWLETFGITCHDQGLRAVCHKANERYPFFTETSQPWRPLEVRDELEIFESVVRRASLALYPNNTRIISSCREREVSRLMIELCSLWSFSLELRRNLSQELRWLVWGNRTVEQFSTKV